MDVHSTRSCRKKESNAEKEPGRLDAACERTTRVRSGRPLRGRVRHVLKEAVVVDMTVLVHLRLAEDIINLCTQNTYHAMKGPFSWPGRGRVGSFWWLAPRGGEGV